MSGICGWFGYGESEDANRALLQRMSEPVRRHAASTVRECSDARGALVCAGSARNTLLHSDSEMAVAISGDARLDEQVHGEQLRRDGLAKTLGMLVRTQGAAALAQLGGTFAVCVFDFARNRALIAVDRNAVQSLAYTTVSNALIVSSNQDCINTHPVVSKEIDAQSLYNYVYFHMVPSPRTAYAKQQRLRPGEYVEFRDGGVRVGTYWRNAFQENSDTAFPQLKQQFLDVLRDGVRDSAQDTNCASFLSGGTDSSTVAGLLTQLRQAPAHTYSIGFSAAGYDEMDYARIAVRHFKTDHHEYYVTADDIVAAVPQIAATYDQPFGNSSVVPTYFCAKLARQDGRERILGGDGGDELFGGNERYAKQRVFEHYYRIPSLLRSALIEPTASLLPETGVPFGKLRSYVQQARIPLPRRLETYNLLERFGAQHVFEADFLRTVDRDEPTRLLEQAYHGTNAHATINKMLALDHQFTLADNDLPKVTRMCELAGIEVAFPLLHDRVAEFAAALRPELKLKGNQLRYFFKEALRDFLPEAIITKQKHGFGLPFGVWLVDHKGLQALVHDSLASLRKRNVIRPAFLNELTDGKVAEHPGYYGTMVWVLMMLELWYQKHAAAN